MHKWLLLLPLWRRTTPPPPCPCPCPWSLCLSWWRPQSLALQPQQLTKDPLLTPLWGPLGFSLFPHSLVGLRPPFPPSSPLLAPPPLKANQHQPIEKLLLQLGAQRGTSWSTFPVCLAHRVLGIGKGNIPSCPGTPFLFHHPLFHHLLFQNLLLHHPLFPSSFSRPPFLWMK